jgi:hypothetical protein
MTNSGWESMGMREMHGGDTAGPWRFALRSRLGQDDSLGANPFQEIRFQSKYGKKVQTRLNTF